MQTFNWLTLWSRSGEPGLMMNDKFEAFRKAMLSSSKKVKGFCRRKYRSCCCSWGFSHCRWYLSDQYTSKHARKNDDAEEALSEGRLSIEKQTSSLSSEDAAAPPTPKSKKIRSVRRKCLSKNIFHSVKHIW